MKTRLLFFAMFIATGLVTSCSEDDEPPPPHIVGNWSLVNYAIINLPGGFQLHEGRTYELDELTLGIEAYELHLQANGSYEREISSSGTLPQTDNGTYTWEEDTFMLDAEDTDVDETYGIEKNDDDRLWITLPIQFSVIEDAILDTLTQEYLNSASEEEYEAMFTPVNLDLVFAFNRDE